MSNALWPTELQHRILEVGMWIEHITFQCYGFAIHPLTIRATDQFLFSTALSKGFEPLSPPTPQWRPTLRRCIVHVKTEFVYLSGFSAFASITEAAHLSLFIVVTRSLVPHFHFSLRALKNPPSIATGGFQNGYVFLHVIRCNPPRRQYDTRGIL